MIFCIRWGYLFGTVANPLDMDDNVVDIYQFQAKAVDIALELSKSIKNIYLRGDLTFDELKSVGTDFFKSLSKINQVR